MIVTLRNWKPYIDVKKSMSKVFVMLFNDVFEIVAGVLKKQRDALVHDEHVCAKDVARNINDLHSKEKIRKSVCVNKKTKITTRKEKRNGGMTDSMATIVLPAEILKGRWTQIMNPQPHDQHHTDPREQCGHMKVYADGQVRINGVSNGHIDMNDEEQRPMCIPQFGKSPFMWHTHPKGMPSVPSAEDIAMLVVEEEDGPCYLHLLFTVEGIWSMYRTHVNQPLISFVVGGGSNNNDNKIREMERLVDDLANRVILLMQQSGMYNKQQQQSSTSLDRYVSSFVRDVSKITNGTLTIDFYPWPPSMEMQLVVPRSIMNKILV
jgi:hypothetical protein